MVCVFMRAVRPWLVAWVGQCVWHVFVRRLVWSNVERDGWSVATPTCAVGVVGHQHRPQLEEEGRCCRCVLTSDTAGRRSLIGHRIAVKRVC